MYHSWVIICNWYRYRFLKFFTCPYFRLSVYRGWPSTPMISAHSSMFHRCKWFYLNFLLTCKYCQISILEIKLLEVHIILCSDTKTTKVTTAEAQSLLQSRYWEKTVDMIHDEDTVVNYANYTRTMNSLMIEVSINIRSSNSCTSNVFSIHDLRFVKSQFLYPNDTFFQWSQVKTSSISFLESG